MRTQSFGVGCACLVALAGSAGVAFGQIDGAVLHTRIFNDFPGSTLTTVNNYPATVEFMDGPIGGPAGWANLHNFHLSEDGGVSDALFANGDAFSIQADVTLLGNGTAEAGLQVAPWWSPNVDGRFNIRNTDGEVAVFGGRLPFYSFTTSHGVTYTPGTTITQKIIYSPNSLTEMDPATIEYIYTDSSGTYSSGPLAFDMGNPAEPYGLWGMLDDARIGGYVQVFNGLGGAEHTSGARFENIVFVPAPAAAGLGLGLGLLGLRRRR